ncbi:MAG: hypothetical protein PHD01_14080 [Geobacteraceae bacterium]|nr:hypothetical protein [Geobacteraceae bacterium]
MIIHSTQKLAAKLPDFSPSPLTEISPLELACPSLYGRRQCVLFYHDTSRYCLFLPSLVKADFADLGRLLRELSLSTLEALNVPKTLFNRMALSMGPVQFDRKTDRSEYHVDVL